MRVVGAFFAEQAEPAIKVSGILEAAARRRHLSRPLAWPSAAAGEPAEEEEEEGARKGGLWFAK